MARLPRNVSRQDRVLRSLSPPLAGRGTRASVDADKRRILPIGCVGGRNPELWSLFRCGFQEQGIREFGVCPSVHPFACCGSNRPRLLGSRIRAYLLLSRSEFIRLDSAESLLVKKETDLSRSPRRVRPSDPPTISNSRCARLVNCLLRHPIPKMCYRMPIFCKPR